MTLVIITKDGYLCKVTNEVDIHAYAAEIGGAVIEEADYTPPPPSEREFEQIELVWRDTEMPKARENVIALQFGETGILGSEQDWKDYWLALRKWTETNPDFPDSSKRPVAPT